MIEFPKPFKTNDLFKGGKNTDLNACVGNNGGPYDEMDYGDGFFQGGQIIVDGAKDRKGPVDILVYPATFAFRHGIELYLKFLLKALIRYNRSDRRYGKNHSIQAYWNEILAEVEHLQPEELDRSPIDEVTAIIRDFVEIDPTGQVFRYPEDIRGHAHLSELALINVEVLGDAMRRLHSILSDWTHWLVELQQRRSEAEQANLHG